MATLEAKNICKWFTHENHMLLRNISFSLDAGESVAIVGKSGEGKTTLLHILSGLDTASSGHVYIDNCLVTEKNRPTILSNFVGFIFQSFYLIESLSVFDNIALSLSISRKNPHSKQYKERIYTLAQICGIDHILDQLVQKLSGGEKQRVAICRACINNPKILFADEPTGSLDYETKATIQKLLFQIHREQNNALLIVTHDQNLAKMCGKMYQLENSQLALI